ncbi:MAG: SH3 domain-containing protein, partial [Clostridia bacterium]|nr:SH3 domain-containing protein [Clostridia bacterium]
MKKKAAVLIVLLLLLSVFAPAAQADGLASGVPYTAGYVAYTQPAVQPYMVPCTAPAPFAAFTGYINGYRINVRANPGTTASICGVVSCGDTIYVTNQAYCTGGRLWYYGRIGTLCGWVYSGYVCGAPVPVSVRTNVTVCSLPGSYGTITMNSTNFRSGPGMYYASLTQLSRGTVLQLLSAVTDVSGVVWYQALSSGFPGWVRSDLVTIGGAYGMTAVPYTNTANFIGFTNTNAVNVRSTPNGTKIAQVPRGTQVYVTGIVCTGGVYWYQINYYSMTAYIRADLVTIGSAGFGVGTLYNGQTPNVVVGSALSDSLYGAGTYVDTTVYGSVYTEPALYGTGYVDPGAYAGTYADPNYGGSYVEPSAYLPAAGSAVPETAPVYPAQQGAYTASEPVETLPAGPVLSFVTCNLTAGQTLPVYTAPNTAALRADNGTAQVTLNESLYAAGYDGQWLLVMYRNAQQMTRVGYVNAFQMQGTLPSLSTLAFSSREGLIMTRTAMTSDPMEQTDSLMM